VPTLFASYLTFFSSLFFVVLFSLPKIGAQQKKKGRKKEEKKNEYRENEVNLNGKFRFGSAGCLFFFGFFFSFSSSNCLVPLVFGLAKKKKGRKSKIGNATQVRSVRPRWNLSGQSRKMSLNNNDINSIMIRTETPTDR